MEESLIPTKRDAAPSGVSVLAIPDRDAQGEIITLREIWRVLRKRKLLVLGCLMGVVVLAGIVSAFSPRRYEAVARVLVNPQNSNALGLDPMEVAAGAGLSNDIVQQTQERVLQSDPLAWDVIKQLAARPAQRLRGQIV